MAKRIAVIGSGISGLVSASLLSQRYEVSLFEANNYLGGHTHTIDVEFENEKLAVDTGFVVFNKRTYPNFCKLIDKYRIPILLSEMSFSFRSDSHDIEYNGHNINTLFADRRNLFRRPFYRFINNILRFNKDAKAYLTTSQSNISLDEFIRDKGYSRLFLDAYLLPVIAAIWSKKIRNVLDCPARFLLQFLFDHGLLSVTNQPDWYVISGGSRNYIPYFTKNYKDQIYINNKVQKLQRNADGVILHTAEGSCKFDAVVLAIHSDQALALLDQPSEEEVAILGAITYTPNEAVLHTDSSLLPKQRRAWASWNYYDIGSDDVTLTYYMNRLQSLNTSRHLCVSVNLTKKIDPKTILHRMAYSHPNFTEAALKAQKEHSRINGKAHTYYCGAYWGHGFHEDGVKSAIEVCKSLGVTT